MCRCAEAGKMEKMVGDPPPLGRFELFLIGCYRGGLASLWLLLWRKAQLRVMILCEVHWILLVSFNVMLVYD